MLRLNFAPFRQKVIRDMGERLRVAGRVGAEAAREVCPVDTGFLKSTIGYAYSQSDMTVRIYADAPYAAYVNFGTAHQAARPFLDAGLFAAMQAFAGGPGNVVIQTPNAPGGKGRLE